MWQRFSEKARRVIFFAQEEAGKLGENYVSPEHILLGIVREPDSTAVRMLGQMGISTKAIRNEIEKQVTHGNGTLGQDMQLTPRAERVIDLVYDEARYFNHNYIGTEHLLLGLLREKEGMAGRVLDKLGADIDKARDIVRVLPASELSESGKQGELTQMINEIRDIQSCSSLKGRSITSIEDLSAEEIEMILRMADSLKKTIKEDPDAHTSILKSRSMAMIFEKPSLRTRVTFEIGMSQLGGHAVYLAPSDIQLGARESVPDVARNLSRWCDVIMARVFAHKTIVGLAENASIPVINGLSDLEHPCQALADFQTIKEKKGELKGLKLAFIGDGNNVAHSLMLLAAKVGVNFAIGCPEGYEPFDNVVEAARKIGEETGAVVEVTNDPLRAVMGADVIYTDVWTSMGQEAQAAVRKEAFTGYQVNDMLLSRAKPNVIVLHCLPAHRGEEITDEVLDGPHSAVLDQAENRLHAQKALLVLVV